MKRYLFLLILFGLWGNGFESPLWAGDFTSHELFMIMQASRSRMISLQAYLERRGYYLSEEKTENPVLMYQQEMEYRRQGERWYCRIVTQTYDSSGKPDRNFTEAAFFDSDKTYFYREEPSGSANRKGRIVPGKARVSGWMSATPDYFLWHAPSEFWKQWQKHSEGRASVVCNKDTGTYLLEFPYREDPNSPWYRYTIDPSKGYMPVMEEWLTSGKELIQRNESSDFRLVDGFWIPFRHRVYLPNGNLGTETIFQSVSINAPIADEKLFFEFPKGTIVDDEVSGTRYRKGYETKREAIKKTEGGGTPEELPPAAADAELEATSAGREKPLVVYPEYVWIEPGRKEYILTIRDGAADKPALSSYRFDSSVLVLAELTDQISEAGKIRLTIERPPSVTRYAEGTLELTFNSGKKTEVYLIAPPILE